ncbi:MAG: U32 family peptidase [Clostridiales bacterium]|nr:U32 family peptidase [Clostridiales bacterium]
MDFSEKHISRPELLSPAGDFESLRAAIFFGADAVYLAGQTFGMRSACKNFSLDELKEAVRTAHENNVKVYLTCNTLPRNDETDALPSFISSVAECGVDAFIVTDIGTFSLVKKYAPNVDIHVSTQAGITNYAAANEFYKMGAKRIIPARELSLGELKTIADKTPDGLEIECFVHGAICVSFSGRCLLSNYLTGRDSNRGDCAQPCRWKYSLVEEKRPGEYFPIAENEDGTYIMNSRDMCMIEHIPELINAGISSFKIEGRAKSAYYVSAVTNAYRCAIDGYLKDPSPDYVPERWIIDEVYKVSHREYCTGFFFGSPKENAEIFYDGGYRRPYENVAVVLGYEDGFLICEQRNRFFDGDELDILERGKKPYILKAEELQTLDGERIEAVPHPVMKFKFRVPFPIEAGALIRKVKNVEGH